MGLFNRAERKSFQTEKSSGFGREGCLVGNRKGGKGEERRDDGTATRKMREG